MASSSSSLALKATSALFSLDTSVDSADEPGDEARNPDVLAFNEHCRAYVKKNDAREQAAAAAATEGGGDTADAAAAKASSSSSRTPFSLGFPRFFLGFPRFS